MNPDDAPTPESMKLKPLSAPQALESYFLEARSKLLDLAAILDRIDRGSGADSASKDPRLEKVRQALLALQEQTAGRAERIQKLFSLDYDPRWEKPKPQ